MLIDENNFHKGNKAMASVLLLYYHLIDCSGFTNDETIYIDPEDFDGFSYLDVKVSDGNNSEINEKLLREGAVIYLLCDLNDMIGEYEDDYLKQQLTQKVIATYKSNKLSAIPEVKNIFNAIGNSELELNYEVYKRALLDIYNKYVVGTFKTMIANAQP